MKKYFIISSLFAACFAFTGFVRTMNEEKPVYIPSSKQRTGGDPEKGFSYLTTGDYVKGGLPIDFYYLGMGKDSNNYLNRDGRNAGVSHEFTAVKANNGEVVVAPNCMQCHAQVFEGELVMGLGNSFADFSANEKMNSSNLEKAEAFLKMTAPAKYQASASFFEVGKTIGPLLQSEVRGVNVAGRLANVLVAHRDPQTLKWSKTALLDIPNEVVPTDVPAWWLLKKKNAMFYSGFGRGDFGKFLMASNLLTVNDTAESREVDTHMPDVLAYLKSLEPPPYTRPIDKQLVAIGEKLFNNNCSNCHGTYGDKEEFPNLLIPASSIQTDTVLFSSDYSSPQFVQWFNKSWFTQGEHPARLEPFNGYIAPPLDGIWVTAPYLHNGSVPTLEALLNSRLRPTYWSRDFNNPEYDYTRIGWKYKKESGPNGSLVYNTTLRGYSNEGHYYGDRLTPEQQKAVLEYLKTL